MQPRTLEKVRSQTVHVVHYSIWIPFLDEQFIFIWWRRPWWRSLSLFLFRGKGTAAVTQPHSWAKKNESVLSILVILILMAVCQRSTSVWAFTWQRRITQRFTARFCMDGRTFSYSVIVLYITFPYRYADWFCRSFYGVRNSVLVTYMVIFAIKVLLYRPRLHKAGYLEKRIPPPPPFKKITPCTQHRFQKSCNLHQPA